jgi:heme exporter protein CcmD
MAEFFDMNGYGNFIWPAYGAVTVVLFAIFISSRRFVAKTQSELETLSPERAGDQDEA